MAGASAPPSCSTMTSSITNVPTSSAAGGLSTSGSASGSTGSSAANATSSIGRVTSGTGSTSFTGVCGGFSFPPVVHVEVLRRVHRLAQVSHRRLFQPALKLHFLVQEVSYLDLDMVDLDFLQHVRKFLATQVLMELEVVHLALKKFLISHRS
ncbi:hypothetical protein F443_10625 [Phytophthora nicotianae P1569]|uniref:Uncharacterized protein n=2 Tax=Phytophthora nicotianae TaxID=4792 RepID=V9F1Q3_PHYNI|nr:hypothetical protein F443_10625 [Phytophthora nicotianae P1569]ETO73326.1 hypothetical protein F444_10722 [Phytophthora nicotianae P1976]